MIAAKKICLKDKAEGRKQGKKKLKHKEAEMLLKKKKRVKFWDQQDLKKTNGLLSKIVVVEAQAWGKFVSYQASPFL